MMMMVAMVYSLVLTWKWKFQQKLIIYHIPEQFTVKAHPALFEREGEGRPKKVALLFQFTIHIHIQNAQTNCEGLHSVRLSLTVFAIGI